MDKDYITIAEAAAIAGVSPQAIYKRLSTSLKPFVSTVEGKKVLLSAAIDILIQPTVEQPFNNVSTPVEQPLKAQEATLKLLEKTVEILQEQLKIKDAQLQTKDDQLRALNDRLEQSLNITGQGNFLMLQEKQRQIIEPDPVPASDPPDQPLPWYKRIFKRGRPG